MSKPGNPARLLIGADSKPVLPRHVKLRHDAVRDRWTILAPERVFTPDPVALAVLQLCDGRRMVNDIAQELTRDYGAPKAQILNDIIEMLQDLVDKGVLQA